ncbi:putative IgGFc-binding protein-like [Apostichopus japonicus]|uniref:Putative IgGFc-binding protein-like n=1 Tax=Stichopus japonicus TaxID=307972 RepID=A0A2G8LBD5_STIJA|nr:putative IgGFc-binding protein-like [Apostichopus japonicus]
MTTNYAMPHVIFAKTVPETIPEWCPANEMFSNETCERTCDDPNTCISATSRSETEQCICVGNYLRQQGQCIPLNLCNCFVADKGGVLMVGDFYINSGCTRRSTCQNNRIIEASYQCSVHATCTERSGVRKCYCNQNYQGDGVTCRHNCFVADIGSVLGVSTVLKEGHFYINSRCTRKSTCRNSRLVDESYQCSSHATCATRSGVRKCYCNQNYEGNGVTCTSLPKDCHELYVSGTRSDGVYTIYPDGWPSGIQVYCEMESNGGGWTVSFANN